MTSHLTQFGLPSIGVVPHGFRVCHFFRARQELVDAMIPYLLAGLKNNERCLWISAPPLPLAEVEVEISAVPELERGVASGDLRIFDAVQWYGEPGRLAPETLVERLIEEEERATAAGRRGLRVSTNNTGVAQSDWERLIELERRLHGLLRDRRIVALSSYFRERLQPVDMLDIVRCHDATLERSDKHWQMFLAEAHGAHRYASKRSTSERRHSDSRSSQIRQGRS